ncbi:uncharacterized protein LOC107657745 [Sinocyclocheilus anshuiensis]|uniref:uncharacterized protein LOC107657745 n=1 Tax=Sinocyclocheilus anshuiensis TaxID=1608454 RepID=UPI0007B7FBB1|nr:PREDICTED: uncharacterized protein LOC107657745 [Sinocyclocheilus anshuiensis]
MTHSTISMLVHRKAETDRVWTEKEPAGRQRVNFSKNSAFTLSSSPPMSSHCCLPLFFFNFCATAGQQLQACRYSMLFLTTMVKVTYCETGKAAAHPGGVSLTELVAATRLRIIMRFSNLLFIGIVTLGTSEFCSAGPLHAQCKVEWYFSLPCRSVYEALVAQIQKRRTVSTCATGGEKCLYKVISSSFSHVFVHHSGSWS